MKITLNPAQGKLIRSTARFIGMVGGRGSGKTLTLKYLQEVIPKEVDLEILYVNCRHHNTSFKILARLLGVQARGASLCELFQRLEARHPSKTVVILDEVDLMSPKDNRREILYLLSRSQYPFMVVMLSNSPKVLRDLDPAWIHQRIRAPKAAGNRRMARAWCGVLRLWLRA